MPGLRHPLMEDNGSGFFVALAILTIITAIVWFVAAALFWLIVILGVLGFVLLSPWIIKGVIEGWRASRRS